MKNYGRLDIYDENCEQVSLGNTAINYSGNDLLIKDSNGGFYFNTTGDGYFSINSLNNNAEVGSVVNTLNSNYNEFDGNIISFNSNYNKVKGDNNPLIINSNSSENYNLNENNVKLLIGNNNTDSYEYTFGNNIKATPYGNKVSKNNYIFGDNYDIDASCSSTFMLNKKYLWHNGVNNSSFGIINSSNKIQFTNTSFEWLGPKANTQISNIKLLSTNTHTTPLFEFKDNKWKSENLNRYNSLFDNNPTLKTNSYTLENNCIIGNSYNSTNFKNSLLILGNNFINTVNITSNSSIAIPHTSNNVTLNQSVLIDSIGNYKGSTLSNCIQIGANVNINVTGLKYDDKINISYKDMSRINDIEGGEVKEIVNRVYAKTTPIKDLTKTDVYTEFNESSLKDCVIYKKVGSDEYLCTILDTSVGTKHNYIFDTENPTSFYVFDIFDKTDNTYFRIYKNKNNFEKDDLFGHELYYKINVNAQTGTRYIFCIKNCKDHELVIKLSNYDYKYNSETNFGIKITNDNLNGTSINLNNISPQIENVICDKMFPKNVITKKIISDNLNANNDIEIETLNVTSIKGNFGSKIDTFSSNFETSINLNGDNVNTLYDDIIKITNDIDNARYIWNGSYFNTFNNTNGLLTLDKYEALSTTVTDLNTTIGYKFNGTEDILWSDYPATYGYGVANFVKWGAMGNFDYTNNLMIGISGDHTNSYPRFKSLLGKSETNLFTVPFVNIPDELYRIYAPIGNTKLNILVYVGESYNEGPYMKYGLMNAIFGDGNKVRDVLKLKGGYSMLQIYDKNYYTHYLDTYSMNPYNIDDILYGNKPSVIQTETLTYMTNIM